MNRWKKEELRKRQEARKGLSPEQIAKLDAEEEREGRIQKQAKEFHIEMFSEEYDHMGDDHVDAKERAKGINPMSAEYVEKVNKKRIAQGILPLATNGMAQSNDSWQLCLEMARKCVE